MVDDLGEKLIHNKKRNSRKDGLNMTAFNHRLKFVYVYTVPALVDTAFSYERIDHLLISAGFLQGKRKQLLIKCTYFVLTLWGRFKGMRHHFIFQISLVPLLVNDAKQTSPMCQHIHQSSPVEMTYFSSAGFQDMTLNVNLHAEPFL